MNGETEAASSQGKLLALLKQRYPSNSVISAL